MKIFSTAFFILQCKTGSYPSLLIFLDLSLVLGGGADSADTCRCLEYKLKNKIKINKKSTKYNKLVLDMSLFSNLTA